MSSYRPITDNWILARAKLKGGRKYYGAYPGGFLERARVLIGCPLDQPMLHVCGGHARYYPYARGFGRLDCTMDLNPKCHPDFLKDCRDENWPKTAADALVVRWHKSRGKHPSFTRFFELNQSQYEAQYAQWVATGRSFFLPWGGILIDPPYSEWEATHYPPGEDKYPAPNKLVATAINTLRIGYKVGILHYLWPQCPPNAISIAKIDVTVGFNNRSRVFAVYERVA